MAAESTIGGYGLYLWKSINKTTLVFSSSAQINVWDSFLSSSSNISHFELHPTICHICLKRTAYLSVLRALNYLPTLPYDWHMMSKIFQREGTLNRHKTESGGWRGLRDEPWRYQCTARASSEQQHITKQGKSNLELLKEFHQPQEVLLTLHPSTKQCTNRPCFNCQSTFQKNKCSSCLNLDCFALVYCHSAHDRGPNVNWIAGKAQTWL